MDWISIENQLPEKALKCWVLKPGDEKEYKAYFYPELSGFVMHANEKYPCGTSGHVSYWREREDNE